MCLSSLYTDLSYYYNWNVSADITQKMLNDYLTYYNMLWEYIKQNKKNIDEEDNNNYKTPLFNTESGIYFNVMKIDFQRAFTNYLPKIVDENIFNIIKKFCNEASKLFLPLKAKKFIYNYTLTNIIVNLVGKTVLAKLRRTVYDDVLYLSNQLGDIIKTEVDGAYLQTSLKEAHVFDVYGNITTKTYKWLVWNNPIMIGLEENKNKVVIKGLGKYTPNIFHKTFQTLVSGSNIERDQCIEDFLYSSKIHILDWCWKTDTGEQIEILCKNNNIKMDSKTNEDINDLYELTSLIDKDKYFSFIEDTTTTIYELVG